MFYPVNLFEIPAKEFVKAKKLSREITPSEFEVDPDEWTKLCDENKGVRLLEGGKKLAREITPSEFEVDPDEWTKTCNENKGVRLLEGGKKLVQEDYDFYDAELKKLVTGDWQKASKIIHTHLTKAKHTTGDMYLLWHLRLCFHRVKKARAPLSVW